MTGLLKKFLSQGSKLYIHICVEQVGAAERYDGIL